ncbi:unnamed protein product [Cercopithifilaria johnstoni]|uniref:BTB domain-containing protein n=1 Tax=Cercopithifilaria johnstoni TaxID=2874296 RepID=A0A8J2M2Q9_9BILA|nr:unnamed protein product [Cercopithifilaria johnstoni]
MNDGTKNGQTDNCHQLNGNCWDSNLEIDYTRQSKGRYFSLDVGDVTFYVDPTEMSKKSLYFELLTTSHHFMEGINGCSRLHDRSEEIACMLHSICPTVYNIYPRIIRVQSIPALARLADKYDLKNLQHCCEYFALRANFQKYGNNDLVKLLQTAIMYNYEKHSLKHNLTNIFGGICYSCGLQRSFNYSGAGNCCCMWKCERCKSVYCLKCKLVPCMVEVEEHLRKTFEKYEMEQLRKEIESEMTAKRS